MGQSHRDQELKNNSNRGAVTFNVGHHNLSDQPQKSRKRPRHTRSPIQSDGESLSQSGPQVGVQSFLDRLDDLKTNQSVGEISKDRDTAEANQVAEMVQEDTRVIEDQIGYDNRISMMSGVQQESSTQIQPAAPGIISGTNVVSGNNNRGGLDSEVGLTIEVGSMVGIELANFSDQVREEVIGEGVDMGDQ